MFYFVLRVIRVSLCVEGNTCNTCFTLCCETRISVEGYVFHFVLKVMRVSLCVEGYTCFTLC